MNINMFESEVEGEIIMDQKRIVKEIVRFYKKIFKDKGTK